MFLQVQRLRGLLGDALPVPSFDRYDSCARSTLKTESFTYTIPNAKHENGHFLSKNILDKWVFVKNLVPWNLSKVPISFFLRGSEQSWLDVTNMQ